MVGQFFDYKMVDSKIVSSQVEEFQVILHEIHTEGMVLSKAFQVVAITEKLPPSWKNFKNYLKYRRKKMNAEDLVLRLWIKEDNWSGDKHGVTPVMAKANVVEHGQSSKNKKLNKSGKRSRLMHSDLCGLKFV